MQTEFARDEFTADRIVLYANLDLAQLRSVQDWFLRYALTAVPGVSEVASVGGFEKQYQVDIDPAKLLAYQIPVTQVMAAIQNANSDVGAMVIELSEREYMVRGLGYLVEPWKDEQP